MGQMMIHKPYPRLHVSEGLAESVMPKARARGGPAKAHFVQLIGAKTRKIQARLNGESWKAGIMFYPADAFFGDGEEQLPIADNARGRIMHFCVVDAERDHFGSSVPFQASSASERVSVQTRSKHSPAVRASPDARRGSAPERAKIFAANLCRTACARHDASTDSNCRRA